ncbi:hypothetical protein [Streptomyces albus]|nr:hypothetical protein [Streptomyces albus]
MLVEITGWYGAEVRLSPQPIEALFLSLLVVVRRCGAHVTGQLPA